MPAKPVIVLTGPTAVGKTSLSIRLAKEIDAEIISSDSRQIYRELTIGTAKPSPAELRSVPHHLIDQLRLPQPYSAGIFAREATRLIDEIHGRGKLPLVVGGSTLYLHALQFGLAEIPPVDRSVRLALQKRLAAEGLESLYHELMTLDPQTARTMDPQNTQRILRGLEVYYGTGAPLSSFYESSPSTSKYRFLTCVLHRDRKELYARINTRVDEMFANGFEEEVKGIMDSGINLDTLVLKTIGYKEMIAHLSGQLSRSDASRLIKRNTRRYAKRQITWFRRYPAYQWMETNNGNEAIMAILMMHINSFMNHL